MFSDEILAALIAGAAAIVAAIIGRGAWRWRHHEKYEVIKEEGEIKEEADSKASVILKRKVGTLPMFVPSRHLGRRFTIFIDNKEKGKIGRREEKELQVESGEEHTIYLKVDDSKSDPITFTLDSGSTIYLVCRPRIPMGIELHRE